MRVLYDYEGRSICLTDERLAYILENTPRWQVWNQPSETLWHDPRWWSNHSVTRKHGYTTGFFVGTAVGDKYLCVVLKVAGEDAFVLTAYLTDKVKRGVGIWPRKR